MIYLHELVMHQIFLSLSLPSVDENYYKTQLFDALEIPSNLNKSDQFISCLRQFLC